MHEEAKLGFEYWLQTLQNTTLPIFSDTHKQFLALFEDDNVSLNQLAKELTDCPILSFQLFCHVNKNREADFLITSIEHAISMLGLDPLKHFIKQLKCIERGSSDGAIAYAKAIGQSVFAAKLSASWPAQNSLVQKEEQYWSTLFYHCPRWALSLIEPQLAAELYQYQSQGMDYRHAEAQVLGCELELLKLGSQSFWPLPHINKNEWLQYKTVDDLSWLKLSRIASRDLNQRTATSPLYARYLHLFHDAKAIKLMKNGISAATLLANRLVLEYEFGWYSKQTLRLTRLLALYNSENTDDCFKHCMQRAIEVSRALFVPYGYAPARSLIHPVPMVRLEKEVATPTPKAKPQKTQPATALAAQKSTPPSIDAACFKSNYQILSKDPELLKDFAHFLDVLCAALHKGLGFERVTIALPDKSREHLVAFHGVGTKEPLRFKIDLSTPSLINKMMQKPSEVWVRGPQQAHIWNQVPKEIRGLEDDGEFMLRSLFSGSRAIALVLADRGLSHGPISDKQRKYFKTLCTAASTAIKNLGERKKKTATKGAAKP